MEPTHKGLCVDLAIGVASSLGSGQGGALISELTLHLPLTLHPSLTPSDQHTANHSLVAPQMASLYSLLPPPWPQRHGEQTPHLHGQWRPRFSPLHIPTIRSPPSPWHPKAWGSSSRSSPCLPLRQPHLVTNHTSPPTIAPWDHNHRPNPNNEDCTF